MAIDAIIFDMDGLLVDSEPLWRQAEMVAFARVGLELTEEMCFQTMGLRIEEVADYWWERSPWEGKKSPREVAEEIIKEMMRLMGEQAQPMAGVEEIFAFFTDRLPLALASSSAHRLIQTLVNKFALAPRLQVICSAEDEKYGKPHPAVYLTTAEKLGVEPRNCLAFEDSLNGLIAAKAAQMKAVVVPDPTLWDKPQWALADLKLRSLIDFQPHHWEALQS